MTMKEGQKMKTDYDYIPELVGKSNEQQKI